MKTAILVDGGFYRVEALKLFGKISPEARAAELARYCQFHLLNRAKYEIIEGKKIYAKNDLYRIFYSCGEGLIPRRLRRGMLICHYGKKALI